MPKIAVVAHHLKKDLLASWVGRHLDTLRGLELVATGRTGWRLLGRFPHLDLECVGSGPQIGDQQIGARM
jgi:methylglyoxal synthase